MMRRILIIILMAISLIALPQETLTEAFLSAPAMKHASVAISIRDADSGTPVIEYNSLTSLKPASILKLLTSAAALEMLGPDHTFRTLAGYSGTLNRRTGVLDGDIVIRGGGDPALGSPRFAEHYGNLTERWISAIREAGIKKVKGRVIADDSYFDYQPVPAKWIWEDIGNYYGAGAYGLTMRDNTYEIHLNTSSGSGPPLIVNIIPEECGTELVNRLISEGTTDQGYVFAAPYSSYGWIEGSVPAGRDNFVLKASIPDPPYLVAVHTDRSLKEAGIKTESYPSTIRREPGLAGREIIPLDSVVSPPLEKIIEFLNKESVNLYAEHLVRELGKICSGDGSTASGTEAVMQFLRESGIETGGVFMEDGSGLSPVNSITAESMVSLLIHMRNKGKYFSEFCSSIPEAGKEGTLKNYFTDPVFGSRMKAKSGSMARVRSYAGYFTTQSGREMAFCIIVNNFTGPSRPVILSIEELLMKIIRDEPSIY